MYYVYVLFSKKDKDLYKGSTDNLTDRWQEHKRGYVDATKNKRPLDLVYYEAYKNKKDALAREQYFKTGWGRRYLRKILKNYLKEQEDK